MPPTYSLWSTTTIILVESNFNVVQGNLHHEDRSTTITNTDSFNVLDSTVIGQSSSLTPTFSVSPNSSQVVDRLDRYQGPPIISDAPHQTVDEAQSTIKTSPLGGKHSSSLHQSSIEARESQHSLSPPRQSNSDETTTIKKHSLIKANRFKSIRTKIKNWLKRVITYMTE